VQKISSPLVKVQKSKLIALIDTNSVPTKKYMHSWDNLKAYESIYETTFVRHVRTQTYLDIINY
jgi:hypothetical protein